MVGRPSNSRPHSDMTNYSNMDPTHDAMDQQTPPENARRQHYSPTHTRENQMRDLIDTTNPSDTPDIDPGSILFATGQGPAHGSHDLQGIFNQFNPRCYPPATPSLYHPAAYTYAPYGYPHINTYDLYAQQNVQGGYGHLRYGGLHGAGLPIGQVPLPAGLWQYGYQHSANSPYPAPPQPFEDPSVVQYRLAQQLGTQRQAFLQDPHQQGLLDPAIWTTAFQPQAATPMRARQPAFQTTQPSAQTPTSHTPSQQALSTPWQQPELQDSLADPGPSEHQSNSIADAEPGSSSSHWERLLDELRRLDVDPNTTITSLPVPSKQCGNGRKYGPQHSCGLCHTSFVEAKDAKRCRVTGLRKLLKFCEVNDLWNLQNVVEAEMERFPCPRGCGQWFSRRDNAGRREHQCEGSGETPAAGAGIRQRRGLSIGSGESAQVRHTPNNNNVRPTMRRRVPTAGERSGNNGQGAPIGGLQSHAMARRTPGRSGPWPFDRGTSSSHRTSQRRRAPSTVSAGMATSRSAISHDGSQRPPTPTTVASNNSFVFSPGGTPGLSRRLPASLASSPGNGQSGPSLQHGKAVASSASDTFPDFDLDGGGPSEIDWSSLADDDDFAQIEASLPRELYERSNATPCPQRRGQPPAQ